jgi:hypothetical protein
LRWPQYNQERDGPRGEEGFYNERAREREKRAAGVAR